MCQTAQRHPGGKQRGIMNTLLLVRGIYSMRTYRMEIQFPVSVVARYLRGQYATKRTMKAV